MTYEEKIAEILKFEFEWSRSVPIVDPKNHAITIKNQILSIIFLGRTPEQIEELLEKLVEDCPECNANGYLVIGAGDHEGSQICFKCNGTGLVPVPNEKIADKRLQLEKLEGLRGEIANIISDMRIRIAENRYSYNPDFPSNREISSQILSKLKEIL